MRADEARLALRILGARLDRDSDGLLVVAAPAPRSGNVISPQLFRRYGYFEGEFPLPIVDRAV